jgi:hypothetical protein
MPPSYTCSSASAERDEPMFATGSSVRGWVLVEVPGAWGEDAVHASAFGEFAPQHWKDELKERHIRVVCIRSNERVGATDVRIYACAARRPGLRPASLWRREVASLADVVPAVMELRVDERPSPEWEREHAQLLLVCTNGRHDQCCANLGRPLVRALRESRWANQVWECSHIGGDRFAPNLVVLPDSLYFGRVEPDSASSVLSALDDGRIELSRFRGRTCFSLAEQAVEHFVRRDLAIDATDGVVIEKQAADGSFLVKLHDRRVNVRVRRGNVSVTEPLTCKGRGDQMVPTFDLVSIT